MTANEARKLVRGDLFLKLKNYKSELLNLRFRQAKREQNPLRIHIVRKNIARILTVLNEGSHLIDENLALPETVDLAQTNEKGEK
ncbi:MAG: 50S ribosomal protein L29 [Oscillospiraceae bacterium]|jgi:ribosomal protein L29|nr:50S ribosomal protein L29 [Oscillospiraceae bacterium]